MWCERKAPSGYFCGDTDEHEDDEPLSVAELLRILQQELDRCTLSPDAIIYMPDMLPMVQSAARRAARPVSSSFPAAGKWRAS
jgi:hypothetical protein